MSTSRMTRKGAVLKALKPRRWVAGYELTKPAVGGSEGLRRVRELRSDGYEIKMRRIPGKQAYEYRLVKTP
jgi:hypothetical protein